MGFRWALALAMACLGGCFPRSLPHAPAHESLFLRDAQTVRADRVASADGELILAGSAVEVTIKPVRRGDELEITLLAHDRALERERYRTNAHGFALMEAAGERYDPALPLLRFPMQVPERWDWSGTVVTGGRRQSAKARVATELETLNIPGGPYRTVRIDVTLTVTSGTTPVERALRWWIAPGQGIVRREFGTGSARGPRPPTNPIGKTP